LGNTVAPGTKADGNGNGIIDAGDYIVWRTVVSLGGSSLGAAAEVPEPATAALAFSVLVLFGTRRTRRTVCHRF
jgi:hypothetical protein